MQKDSIDPQEIIQATDECVMCGLCLPHCPTYNIAQIEPESPRGRIALVRALYEEKIPTNKTLHDHLHQCLSCMNCQDVCPANINYEKIIDAGRSKTASEINFISAVKHSLILLILSNTFVRKCFKTLITLFRTLGLLKLFSGVRLIRLLSDKHPTFNSCTSSGKGPKVAVLQSCANDIVNDPAYEAAISLLNKLDCEVIQQNETLCCGALHQHSGKLNSAQNFKRHFIRAYSNKNIDFFITIATGCGAQIKHYENELSSKVIDINEFLQLRMKDKNIVFKPLTKNVFVHKPCTQKQITTKTDVIEQLLNNIPEINFVNFDDPSSCCGAGGMNSIAHPHLANRLIDKKISQLKTSENALIVSSNIGCAMHMQARLKQENTPVQVCHPVTLLAQQML